VGVNPPRALVVWAADRGRGRVATMLSTEAGKRKTRVVDRLMGHGDAGG
jgi:hypothetical protein